ncbi:carotenoid oxygenase [Pisolithus croceorrhizus]|nr:carotenoid oxygenase [Pisolithus croceorrhizus]KAI6122932.1 carotenoid oxygenase [Pisolithus croceorrhizus]KAI6168941.1 carotenoid oxygenase [Pisolithus thermaeus]
MAPDTTSFTKHFNNWPNDTGFEVIHEEREPVELTVSGHIPSYVSGTLYRAGPGGRQVKTDKGTTFAVDHWFDGFSQNHRFQIIQTGSSTRVVYNSRRSVDPLIENIRLTGNMAGFSFGQKRDPCTSFFKKVMSVFVPGPPRPQEEANIGVTLSINPPGFNQQTNENRKGGGHASGIHTLLAKTDVAVVRHIDPETLEPRGVVSQKTLHPKLTGNLSAAHTKSDPISGDVFNYNLAFGRTATYRVFRVSAATGQTEILATITDAPGAYLHSSLITENYFILCVWSGCYAWGGLKILWEKNMLDAISPFNPNRKALWYVIDRKQGKGVVAKYECDPFFCFHTINAWEEASPTDPLHTDIVADLSIYKNLDILKKFYFNNLKSSSPTSLNFTGEKPRGCDVFFRRWRLPSVNTANPRKPREAVVVHTAEHSHSPELPVINPRLLTKPSRYVYGACDRSLSTFFDGLVKYDVQTQTATYFSVHGHSPGEGTFIPDPNGTAEDDGVLLSVVLDGFTGKSYLLVLDAKTMKEVGRASMDFAVNFGFHGAYCSQGVKGPVTDI